MSGRLLILFALWSPDDAGDSRTWLDWYGGQLDASFRRDDLIVAVNASAAPAADAFVRDRRNVLAHARTRPGFEMDSDASAYQLALDLARTVDLSSYAGVALLHAKGVSHPFPPRAPWRARIAATLFDRDARLADLAAGAGLIADAGYLLQSPPGIAEARAFAARLHAPAPPLALAAGASQYLISRPVFEAMLHAAPDDFLASPLPEQGYNRYFFESVFPSAALAFGAEPAFCGGAGLNSELNRWCNFDFDPAHNTAIVLSEHAVWRSDPSGYRQPPLPYVLGDKRDHLIAFAAR